MANTPSDPIEIYRARNLGEAFALRNLLEANAIPASIENEFLQGALGDLPIGWSTAPRIVVDRAHETVARAIVEEFHRTSEPIDSRKETGLRCMACDSPMENHNTCPACGWSYGVNENVPDVGGSHNDIALQISADASPPVSAPASIAPADYLSELRDWGKLLFGCAFIAWIVFYVQPIVKCYVVRSWPVTRAVVIDRRFGEKFRPGTDAVRADIDYRYSVDGKEYSVRQYSPTGGELSPEQVGKAMHEGGRDVYYNPEDLSESYFEHEYYPPGIGTYIGVSMAFLVGAKYIWLGFRGLRRGPNIALESAGSASEAQDTKNSAGIKDGK